MTNIDRWLGIIIIGGLGTMFIIDFAWAPIVDILNKFLSQDAQHWFPHND